jgi:neutral ceramidase
MSIAREPTRRDFLKDTAAALAGMAMGGSISGEGAAASAQLTEVAPGWQVGFAQADSTPRPGQTIMTGFARERYADGVLAPLRAQAMVFQDAAGRRAVLCTADVLGFGPDTLEVLRHRLQTTYGLPPNAVCLAASHTHWGPGINYRFNFMAGGVDVWYVDFLERTILRLVGEAMNDLAPAEINYGACEVQIGGCRRLPGADGKIHWGLYLPGRYDQNTPILRITRERSPKQIVVVAHGCHPTSTGLVSKWSPDYPGAMRDRLEAELGDCRAVFVMGCGGDTKVTAKNPQTGEVEFAAHPDQSRAAGEKLADHVLRHLRDGKFVSLSSSLQTASVCGELSFQEAPSRRRIVEMATSEEALPEAPYSIWWARQSMAYPDDRKTLPYEVQRWRLGPLTLLALQGEVCSDWGGMIRAMSPTDPVMVVAYANHCPGYIPTARIVREGGYEGDISHMVYFLPAPFQPKVEDELTALIRQALDRRVS